MAGVRVMIHMPGRIMVKSNTKPIRHKLYDFSKNWKLKRKKNMLMSPGDIMLRLQRVRYGKFFCTTFVALVDVDNES